MNTRNSEIDKHNKDSTQMYLFIYENILCKIHLNVIQKHGMMISNIKTMFVAYKD